MPKVIQYRNKCIGCNVCVEHAPDCWFIDEDGKATLKDSKKENNFYVREITPAELSENQKAAEDCPVKIIKVLK